VSVSYVRARLGWTVLMAVILAAIVDFLYVSEFVGQPGHRGYPLPPRQAFVAIFIAIMAMAAALSVSASAARWRTPLLGLSAIGLLAMGYIAMFSIGLPLFVAGLLSLMALIVNLRAGIRFALLKAAAGGLLALGIFLAGFELTAEAITCPARGFEAGDGSSLFRGPFHYTCVDGKLTIRPGPCTHGGATIDASGHIVAVTDCWPGRHRSAD
jgi:hypothetical protein